MHMDELKEKKIWFCWGFETRGGKRTKVPKSIYGTATETNAEYAHTWASYDEAAAAVKKIGADGVGFKIPDGYFFLDVDHRDVSDPYVQLLPERFDSYAERSVSGGGIHIYGKCDVGRLPTYSDKDGKLRLDKLYAERGGIVYKAIRALQTVIANGYRFSEPASVTAERERYMSENSTVVSFFEECMCPWPYGRIHTHCTTGRIYRVYQAWCKDNNNGFAKTAKEFREDLAAHLGSTYAEMTTRVKGNSYYREYTLTPGAKEQYELVYGRDGAEPL